MTFFAGSSIFLAAFLLFALEPLVAKRILPWFGGSSAVWSVCLVFYQVALLAGYGYARLLVRFLRPRQQAIVHVALLLLSLAWLPIGPTMRWRPGVEASPSWLILAMLAAAIGLPFVVLSATSPLLQDWLAQLGDNTPYRFFAWSNFASLAALIAYPVAIEPHLDSNAQSFWWSAAFAVFVATCSVFALRKRAVVVAEEIAPSPVSRRQRVFWFALSACGSMLLLAITNHIDENVAAVPLLWVLPLAVYLTSFITAFGSSAFYQRQLWLRFLAFGLAMLAYAAYNIDTVLPVQISIPIFLGGLFIGCVFCQGELYRLRPEKSALTTFYLTIAFGSACGAVFVGLVAPLIFGGVYELPLSLTLAAALALALTWDDGGWSARFLWASVTACMAAVFVLNWQAYNADALALRRNFYGSLRVVEGTPANQDRMRILYHGTIRHGSEFLPVARRMEPTTYYGQTSGVGLVLRDWPAVPKRVAVIGLGTGTLAVYGNAGDTFRFYELNPQVIQLAQQFFYFLPDSKAHVELVEGDARLSLEREKTEPFDVIVLDAFSGDAIPVHLLTKEAMDLYLNKLRPGGVLAFHVSNDFLDLAPVIRQLAAAVGYQCVVVRNHADTDGPVLASEWVLVTNNARVLDDDLIKLHAVASPRRNDVALWTDESNSLLPILKTPEVR